MCYRTSSYVANTTFQERTDHPICVKGKAVDADTLFIVQRKEGEVMISPFAGPDRPEKATQKVAEQVSSGHTLYQRPSQDVIHQLHQSAFVA